MAEDKLPATTTDGLLTSEGITSIVADTTRTALNLIEAQEELLKTQSEFLSWLVGVGGGALLIFAAKAPELTYARIGVSLVSELNWMGGSYFVCLATALSFKILLGQNLASLSTERTLIAFQESQFRVDSSILGRHLKPPTAGNIAEAVLMKLGLPTEQFNRWFAGRVHAKKVEQLSEILHYISALAFACEMVWLAVLVRKLLHLAA